MIYAIDLFGVAVFAISGALLTRSKRFDLFGVIVVALVTALGGGTTRDLILGRTPVFWLVDVNYIFVGTVAATLTFMLQGAYEIPQRMLLIADAFGLAFFAVIGANITLEYEGAQHLSPFVAILMGMVTATAGGIVRDLLYNRVPLILQREIYATAALAGSTLYVFLVVRGGDQVLSALIAMALTFSLRLVAIKRNWHFPITMRDDPPVA